jgi:tetratricopeptide (TPR) repeat protein
MQEDVVTTCLAIDQPRRALSYIEKIDNWRRGSTYADLAFYLSRHGDTEHVDRYLALADEIADQKPADTNEQGWRPELIKTKIAAVLVAKSPAEAAPNVAARVAELDAMVDHGGLEETQRALIEFAKLYEQNYADETRRNMLYSKVRNSWKKSPIQIRFDTVMKLADAALAHEDAPTALVLAGETRTMVDAVDFAPEDRIPLVARLADLLRRAGDAAGAKTELAGALALYDKNAEQIVDIYRAQALRPLAEQYQKLGDTKQALELYGRAIEAGVQNPNSRPRADDLQAVCCSLARVDVDPGAALLKRLHEIRAGLRDPW